VSVAVIINPISGTGRRPDRGRVRAEFAAATTERHGVIAEVFVTERPGHARELASAALERGVQLVIAWGGDGTVNEVASAVAFRDADLGIVPSGSGNGLARELRIPFDAAQAIAGALTWPARTIDCGELDGRLFVNVAGLGLDARVAHQFAARGVFRRGFLRYLEIAARELLTYEPGDHTVVCDGVETRTTALLIALANARQYGNGAIIAPQARLDDGRLDVVVVANRPVWQAIRRVPALFRGRIAEVPGVTITQAAQIEISSARQMLYHVDGEPFVGGRHITARARRAALRVRLPATSHRSEALSDTMP
jgi:YegS/Rv2252/BmrU family lipid kinase